MTDTKLYLYLRNTYGLVALACAALAPLVFLLASYTSCLSYYGRAHRLGQVDCMIQGQPLSDFLQIVALLLVFAAVVTAAIALTSHVAGRPGVLVSPHAILMLIGVAVILILATPVAYHFSAKLPYNPWDQSKNIPYEVAGFGSVFVLPGLAIATLTAAATCAILVYRPKASVVRKFAASMVAVAGGILLLVAVRYG